MPAAIAVSAAVDTALRKGFSEASVRLKPDTKISDIVKALEALGLTVAIQDGTLVMSQGSTTMHTTLALRSLTAKPEFAPFFVLETLDPKTWTNARKMAYVTEHGSDAFGKLCSQPVVEAGIKVLDANMGRADYSNLTRSEKLQFIREYGDAAVQRIFQKEK